MGLIGFFKINRKSVSVVRGWSRFKERFKERF